MYDAVLSDEEPPLISNSAYNPSLSTIIDSQRNKPSYTDIELSHALDDLDQVLIEAYQENFPIPSQIAKKNAEFLIQESYRVFPSRFEVYPDQDGAIAIDIHNGKGKSVLLLCESTGEMLCLADVDGKSSRKRYSQSEIQELPDSFIEKALEEL